MSRQIIFPTKPVGLNMHEKQFSDCKLHSVLRVYNGWIYSTYDFDGGMAAPTLKVSSSVFVPMHKKEKESGSE